MKEVRIINQGPGAIWFENQANILARNCWGIVTDQFDEQANHYILQIEKLQSDSLDQYQLFIPQASIAFANDKRLQATVFQQFGVPTPETHLLATENAMITHLRNNTDREWLLKFPTGLGARGHRLVTAASLIELHQADFFTKTHWPRPFILQEFIRNQPPEVYRAYCVDTDVFAWNVRRFPTRVPGRDLVAHALGAQYYPLTNPPPFDVQEITSNTLQSVGLLQSFGVVDLIRSSTDGWLALEVGTDGNGVLVDRDFQDPWLEHQLNRRIAEAIWQNCPTKPWGPTWHPRN